MKESKIASGSYRVHERFLSFQGEGCHMGRRSFVIRLVGCPLRCPWCDSAGTWHREYMPEATWTPISQLVQEAEEANPLFTLITGGEPTIHTLTPLVHALADVAPVHLETCGAFVFRRGLIRWMTLSPKWSDLPTRENLLNADELKLIICEVGEVERWITKLKEIMKTEIRVPVWLHPEWSRRESPEILGEIVSAVKASDLELRAGWQVHKLYRADNYDARIQAQVPLGGDEANGY